MKCPSCRKTVARDGNPRFPFCSERCRLVDLGRWVNEEYRIPDEPSEAALEAIEQLPDPDREQ